VEILSEFYPDNTYLLFAPKKKPNNRLATILSRHNIAFVFPKGIFRLFSSLWRVWGIKKDIRKQAIAVFHGLSNELPVGIEQTGIKTVVSIHDLIFLRYPEYYKSFDRAIYRRKFKRACEKADKIVAISECTKRDIVSFFLISEEKINVIYQSCHPVFKEKVPEEKKQIVVEKYSLPSRFLLYVGSIESRKNLLLAVKALKQLPEDIHLVAIGKSTPYQSKVEAYAQKSGLESRLHIKNAFPFEDLPAVYQLSELFIYPSFFEGFGIPIVEALMSEIPVIAATGSCLEEAGGPDSIYINPDDDTELAQKITAVLNDKTLAQKMIESGKKYAKRFSDKEIASEMMAVYQSLISPT
jgi:glycosyltransferase involved in cell wall biosynthesis